MKFYDEKILPKGIVRSFFRRDSFYVDEVFQTREECLEFLTDKAVEAGRLAGEAEALRAQVRELMDAIKPQAKK